MIFIKKSMFSVNDVHLSCSTQVHQARPEPDRFASICITSFVALLGLKKTTHK